jgi:hypothetical protein
MIALDQLKRERDNAPAESSLNGQRIRIAGYRLTVDKVAAYTGPVGK